MPQSIMIRPTVIVSIGGSKVSSSARSIKDFWGVVVPSDFMPRGGGKTIMKHSVRLPRYQDSYLEHLSY